ncbi:MAG: prenyltransferase [Nitrospirae bacterium RBG_13_39_12]|nr:MAG: prenyltransferase [Nitrospirae bacterium RBG_13_39_12]
MKNYILLIRPHQYIKNLFIFLPLFFSLKMTDFNLLLKTMMAFIAFSLVASSVYIFNDYHDIEEDRKHPTKKNRPLASGKVSKQFAKILMIILLIFGLAISYLLKSTVFYLILSYFILNLLYTLKLKHIVIIDTFIIATGFVIRIFVGSQTGNIWLSMWIIIMTFLLALFIALAKRRDDVLIYLETGDKTRKIIDGYNLEFLNTSMVIMASVVIVSYIMYTISSDVVSRMHSENLYLTVVFVILGLLRYMHITIVEKKSGSPTEMLLRDRFLQLSILGWIATFILLIYV